MHKNLCRCAMISQGKSKECAGGRNIEQYLPLFFFSLKKLMANISIIHEEAIDFFFWLEGLAPFDLSSPEEKAH